MNTEFISQPPFAQGKGDPVLWDQLGPSGCDPQVGLSPQGTVPSAVQGGISLTKNSSIHTVLQASMDGDVTYRKWSCHGLCSPQM